MVWCNAGVYTYVVARKNGWAKRFGSNGKIISQIKTCFEDFYKYYNSEDFKKFEKRSPNGTTLGSIKHFVSFKNLGFMDPLSQVVAGPDDK